MDEELKPLFHAALEKDCPSLTHDGREAIINGVLDHCFAHPWMDSEVQMSIIGNIARQHKLEGLVPENYREED